MFLIRRDIVYSYLLNTERNRKTNPLVCYLDQYLSKYSYHKTTLPKQEAPRKTTGQWLVSLATIFSCLPENKPKSPTNWYRYGKSPFEVEVFTEIKQSKQKTKKCANCFYTNIPNPLWLDVVLLLSQIPKASIWQNSPWIWLTHSCYFVFCNLHCVCGVHTALSILICPEFSINWIYFSHYAYFLQGMTTEN